AFFTLLFVTVFTIKLSVVTGRCGPCCSVAPIVIITILSFSTASFISLRVLCSHITLFPFLHKSPIYRLQGLYKRYILFFFSYGYSCILFLHLRATRPNNKPFF